MKSNWTRRLRQACRNIPHDQGGNVLILTAAAIFPLLGIIGSGIDIGRAYMTELRLQQACDAGVLAGRRAMAGGLYLAAAQDEADKMFYFNFPAGMYGTRNADFSSRSTGSADVVGIATAQLPTALMYIFGYPHFNLSVECGAKLEISNTDVMMVLDVTGSMVLDSGNKLAGLKTASNRFLDTLMTADVGDGRIRIGIVPYALAVNVKDVLKVSGVTSYDWISNSLTAPSAVYSKRASVTSRGNTTWYDYYTKKDIIYNVQGLKTGSVRFPIGKRGATTGTNAANVTHGAVVWEGCVTEVKTQSLASGRNFDLEVAWDMDIDYIPSGSDDAGKWKMYVPKLTYVRNGAADQEVRIADNSEPSSNTSLKSFFASGGNESGCPVPAMKLTEMNAGGRTAFTNKIQSLAGQGYTYHDAGMIWGGRLISPDGMFKSENRTAANGKPISRHLIFMTDGKMDTSRSRYSHQGVEQIIPRVGSSSTADSNARHTHRFKQICKSIQAKGITIWVVAFGFPAPNRRSSEDNANFANLEACASPNLMYDAADSDQLGEVFTTIAGQISRLRVSQ